MSVFWILELIIIFFVLTRALTGQFPMIELLRYFFGQNFKVGTKIIYRESSYARAEMFKRGVVLEGPFWFPSSYKFLGEEKYIVKFEDEKTNMVEADQITKASA